MTERVELDRRDPRPHNRLRRRLKDFTDRWGDVLMLVLATGLVCVAVVVAVIAMLMRADTLQERRNSVIAREQARQTCLRTRAFAPALADAYERLGMLDGEQLRVYRATIPDDC